LFIDHFSFHCSEASVVFCVGGMFLGVILVGYIFCLWFCYWTASCSADQKKTPAPENVGSCIPTTVLPSGQIVIQCSGTWQHLPACQIWTSPVNSLKWCPDPRLGVTITRQCTVLAEFTSMTKQPAVPRHSLPHDVPLFVWMRCIKTIRNKHPCCRKEAAWCFVSVSSFNTTVRQVQVLLQIYHCEQINSVLFSSLRRGRAWCCRLWWI